MTTVTGLTADRMLAIEAASVVDGDVDASGNLILTKRDGSKINAGSVIGPPGPQGPVGSFLSVLAARSILDVGLVNQIRAGRQLSPADFANIGLSAPLGLWNLSDLTDASGNGRNLQNKGAVPFTAGINGVANTAAQFVGSTAQALYIPDTGVNDPFRLKTGTIGCWSRSAKTGLFQEMIAKYGSSSSSWYVGQEAGNRATIQVSIDGSTWIAQVYGVTNLADDRWHFTVAIVDGTTIRIYVDGMLEGVTPMTGVLFPSPAPLNIGSVFGDGSTASAAPFFGRIDEAFITSDILTEDQIRNLYCAKIPHALGSVPSRITLNVRRRRIGAAFAPSDFPSQPTALFNFSAGSVADEGSNNTALTVYPPLGTAGCPVSVSGVDGTTKNAYQFLTASQTNMYGTDAGLPAALTARSFGLWFKCSQPAATMLMLNWGTYNTAAANLMIGATGSIYAYSNADALQSPANLGDNTWHHVVVVEDNGEIAGIKRKMYIDGRLVVISTVMNPITLAGAAALRIGAAPPTPANFFNGTLDGIFICNYALTADQIRALYFKGSQTLAPSPKNVGDHVEAMSATDILATFDMLDSQHQIDLSVAA